jgi:HlyD family secretion protein
LDKVIDKQTRFFNKTKIVIILVCASVLACIYGLNSAGLSFYTVKEYQLTTGQVQQGPFNVTVRGVGKLVPKNVSLEVANVDAKIDKILVKPGTIVKQGQPLLHMSNPALGQQRNEIQWQLEALAAENMAEEVALKSKVLDQRALLLEIQFRHDRISLRVTAESALLKQGNHTVSLLGHKENQLLQEQLLQRLEIEKLRQDNLHLGYATQQKAWRAKQEKLQRKLNQAQARLEQLTVRASINGILQALPLAIGQRVTVGSELAKLANHDVLIAQLQVSQLHINLISVGQMVLIDTKNSLIKGNVSRIAPLVVDGEVMVEVALSQSKQGHARAELNVSGLITVSALSEAIYLKRPYLSQSHQSQWLYRLDERGFANKVLVTFGLGSADKIQVQKGLNPGDKIVLSDTSSWQSHQTVKIN